MGDRGVYKKREIGGPVSSLYPLDDLDFVAPFLALARDVSRKSPCLSAPRGAILVCGGKVVSEGYNAPVLRSSGCRGVVASALRVMGKEESSRFVEESESLERKCPRRLLGFREGEGLRFCPAIHAEQMAVLCGLGEVSYDRLSQEGGFVVAWSGPPCGECLKLIGFCGLDVVCLDLGFYDELSKALVEEWGEGRIHLFDMEEALEVIKSRGFDGDA